MIPLEDVALDAAVRSLVGVGRVLFNSTDEHEMLTDVCRVLIEEVRYRLAWVGMADTDPKRTVRVVASDGETGYLDGLFVSWDDVTAWGRGPTGTATREGTVQVIERTADDERYQPWVDRAARFGIGSACALPFELPNGLRGTLNIYAREANAFTERALGFLTEIAAGIGRSVARIRATTQFASSLTATIESLSTAVETRDPYTAGHQARVAALARAIAAEMGLPPLEVEGIALAAEVHDIGKLAVPVEILTTPNLIAIEYELIKTHSLRGYEILDGIAFPWPLATWVLQHHERLDGSGYPDGLSGDQILLGSRIVAIADVVESMASYRPYRRASGLTAAMSEIQAHAGRLYDHDVVAACVTVLRGGWDQFSSGPRRGRTFVAPKSED